jgi:hypothetical protein
MRESFRPGQRRVMALVLYLAATAAMAQMPLPTPGVAIGRAGRINAIARQSDGSLVIGGEFTRVDGVARRNLARLHPDGTLDASWRASTDNAVYSIAIDAHDDVFVTGAFAAASGEPRASFAKFEGHGTGAVDAAWNPGTQVASTYAPPRIVIASDGSVFAFVSIFHSDTFGERNVVKMPPVATGAIDFSWNPAIQYVSSVAADPSGALYIGGYGTAADGCVHKVSPNGPGAAITGWRTTLGGNPLALATAAAGSLYASSDVPFDVPGGGQRYIVRFAAGSQGEIDAGWSPEVSHPVLALGWRAAADRRRDQPRPRQRDRASTRRRPHRRRPLRAGRHRRAQEPFRLTPEGSLDSAWNASDTADAVVALAVGADGDVFAGLFVASDTAAQPVRRYAAASGALDPTWSVSIGGGGDPSPMIRSLAHDGRGPQVVGGLFNRIGGAARAGLARFAVDSGTLDAWTVPQVGGADELALAADGMMYIARDTTGYAGSTPIYSGEITKIDPGNDAPTVVWTRSLNGYPTSIAIAADGSLFAGGYFELDGDAVSTDVLKLSPQGDIDAAWTAATASANEVRTASALTLDGEGRVYISGGRTSRSPDGIASYASYLVRRTPADGGTDGTWQPSIDGYTSTLLAAPPQTLVIGGQFSAIIGSARDSIAAVEIRPSNGTSIPAHSVHARPPLSTPPPPSPSPGRLRPTTPAR